MPIQITTHGDALRHTARRVVVAASLAVVMTAATMLLHLGTDLDASVRVGYVMISSICAAVAISALLAGALTYRSALLMQELTLTRSELSRLSHTDQLTGLLNRRGFDAAAALALRSAFAENLPAVVFMCDVDLFKSINDRFGHEFGDKVLVEIGDVLRSFARSDRVVVGRHGGEEFAALMVGITHDQAAQYAEDIREACAAREISIDENSARVTISIGFTVTCDEIDLSKIMRVADRALYAAKHGGRNRVARADASAPAATAASQMAGTVMLGLAARHWKPDRGPDRDPVGVFARDVAAVDEVDREDLVRPVAHAGLKPRPDHARHV
jgi:diguanylate cyclase (GGDEF)-like protein